MFKASLKKLNNCDGVDKSGEKKKETLGAVKDKGQASNTDNVYQPVAGFKVTARFIFSIHALINV